MHGAASCARPCGGWGRTSAASESNLLVWAAFYWNYLPMKPGMFAQAVHMKLRRGLPYSRFVTYLLAGNLVGLFIRSVLGLALTVPLAVTAGLTPVIPALFAALTLACGVVMAMPIRWDYQASAASAARWRRSSTAGGSSARRAG